MKYDDFSSTRPDSPALGAYVREPQSSVTTDLN